LSFTIISKWLKQTYDDLDSGTVFVTNHLTVTVKVTEYLFRQRTLKENEQPIQPSFTQHPNADPTEGIDILRVGSVRAKNHSPPTELINQYSRQTQNNEGRKSPKTICFFLSLSTWNMPGKRSKDSKKRANSCFAQRKLCQDNMTRARNLARIFFFYPGNFIVQRISKINTGRNRLKVD
jgi:hypothetical protein